MQSFTASHRNFLAIAFDYAGLSALDSAGVRFRLTIRPFRVRQVVVRSLSKPQYPVRRSQVEAAAFMRASNSSQAPS